MADRWSQDDILTTYRKPVYETLEVRHGMVLIHTASNTKGKVGGFSEGDRIVLIDDYGEKQLFKAHDGAFTHEGVRVALRSPTAPAAAAMRLTTSGSIDTGSQRAKVARASRIWVEGLHDAELLEKIWGDDLREVGVVIEPLHGADDLATAIARFRPGAGRRLGVLLDHLVEGSKESRIAKEVVDPAVLVCGHPYVDIWAAIAPGTIGLDAWPTVPMGQPWKEGVLDALGIDGQPGRFWAQVLDAVTSYRDVETPLVTAVERLIDFVTAD